MAVTCKGCAMFVLLPEIDVAYPFNQAKLVALLEEQLKGPEWRVSTLPGRRDGEEFLDGTVELQQQQEAQEVEEQQQAEAEVENAEVRNENQEESPWKRVTVRSRRTRRHSAPAEALELSNRFQLLEGEAGGEPAEQESQGTSRNSGQEAEPQLTKKKRRVVVVGDPLLRGIAAQVRREDPWTRQLMEWRTIEKAPNGEAELKVNSSGRINPIHWKRLGSPECQDSEKVLKEMKELFRRERKHGNALCVERASVTAALLKTIKEFIQGRSPINA